LLTTTPYRELLATTASRYQYQNLADSTRSFGKKKKEKERNEMNEQTPLLATATPTLAPPGGGDNKVDDYESTLLSWNSSQMEVNDDDDANNWCHIGELPSSDVNFNECSREEHQESAIHNLDVLSGEDSSLQQQSQTSTITNSDRKRRYSIDAVAEGIHNVTDIVMETVVEVKEELKEIIQEEIIPVKPREEGDHSTKLSAVALAVLVFYKVSGGPFGCEPAVKTGGPFYALLGFALFPLVWCVQEALVTAELGAAYPEPSGAVAWIEEAFGPKAGLVCGYFHWVSGATDNAIYPSLFLQYVAQFIGSSASDGSNLLTSGPVRFMFTILMSAVLAFVNWCGLEIVGTLSIVVCVISMSPFVILCFIGFTKVDPSRWLVLPDTSNGTALFLDDDDLGAQADTLLPALTYGGVMWRPFINSLFWNLNSFDVGASFAGEVQDPDRVFPRAMFLSVLFVVLGYLIPLLLSIGASTAHQSEWEAGSFTRIAEEIAGPWLAAWMLLAAAVSNIGLFEAEMSGDAYQLMGMADRGLIPKVFSKRSRFGTPTNGILVGTAVIFCLGVADFDALVEMLNFAYAIALLMEFTAFIKLRITDPDGKFD
jgi:amino acid transporter